MQNLLDFLARHFHWLVFLLLETVSGILLFSYNSYQGSTWISTANAVTGKTLELQADVEQFFSLKRLNEELSHRNIVLEQQLAIYREQLASNSQKQITDTCFLPSDSSSISAKIPAKVIANTIDRRDNLITIDRGRADGVRPDMGVISGTGLVGVVYMASEHYSIVLPVLNSRSRISCSIRGRNYFGYLTWPGGSPVEAYVEDIPRHARFQKGDWVETSGYSAIFPKGVAVGKITNIYNSRDGLSYSLKVHLSTDFACLRDVFVINDVRLPEQRQLMESARDSLEMK
ncbi:MAG: rod shape-determining protein MreC [Prevotella sp.]|nr:rod shape-determining protein MreC [Prevotella sp.]MBR3480103.1 rod shape-determining protein MreC [Prevotella sp.]MBR6190063.1 rod shape-determining protein MreC [Prevotella sp.]